MLVSSEEELCAKSHGDCVWDRWYWRHVLKNCWSSMPLPDLRLCSNNNGFHSSLLHMPIKYSKGSVVILLGRKRKILELDVEHYGQIVSFWACYQFISQSRAQHVWKACSGLPAQLSADLRSSKIADYTSDHIGWCGSSNRWSRCESVYNYGDETILCFHANSGWWVVDTEYAK
jgi:hypothetical protein